METTKRKSESSQDAQKKIKTNDQQQIDDEDVSHLEHKNWQRPPLIPVDPIKDKIVFQQFDCDYTVGEAFQNMPGPVQLQGPIPIIRMWGVTESGNSVQCNIYGVLPYFFVPAPNNFQPNDCEPFRKKLNSRLESSGRDTAGLAGESVLQVEIVKKESILGYSFDEKKDFLKIVLRLPKQVPTCRTILESGFTLEGYGDRSFVTFESNIPFALRFMIDRDIMGASWVEIPSGAYVLTPKNRKSSTCQLEIDIGYDKLISHAPEGEWSKLAPFRILSFDIECSGRKGVFPEPEQDPVIQIANLVTVQGESKPIIRNVFNLKTCSKIVGAQVLDFQSERDMLLEWKRFIREADPDVIIGYNIANFDFPYLINRAKALKIEEFFYLGRITNSKSKVKDTTFSSKAYGTRETKETTMEGRVQLDILQVIQREHKLRSYSLNSVSAQFLAEQKEEVHHSIISDLFNGDDDDRRRLAVYCLKDAYLPQRLLDKLMIMFNHIEMARVTGVPVSYLLSRGQQIKVVSQLYRKANKLGLLIPCYKVQGSDDEATYEGATVIEPIRGFYETPIATLDFASLYPSIMMAHNLCYCTLVRNSAALSRLSEDQYEKTPTGSIFVKSSVRKGVLPMILEELLEARKRAKDDLKNEKDPAKRAVLDGRQLALKISANSVYGFTGASVGKLPCLEISASVTAYGRQMIELTKKLVEEHYTQANGYEKNATVVYGDTDSVMVQFHVNTVEQGMKLGKEAAAMISNHFTKPIKLEFEKVYCPYLLIQKKRYAGLLWTRPDKHDKIDAKGIETVRRDNCPLVKNVISTCLHKILIERDAQGAQDYTKSVISDLLQNKMDLSLLVITKALSKEGKEYANKQAHVELAERMRKRDPHTAPAIGDRVPYVLIKATKGAKAYERSEDPLWVLENNIPLDYQYYLENQLKNPLTRIFSPLMEDPNTLLVGAHTRCIAMPTPKQGGIMKFAQKTLSCIGCKAPLQPGEHTTCKQCTSREPELYQHQMSVVSNLERQFAKVWTQCQVCQGSLHQTVLCTSRDCPIFYMRKKVQKDLKDAQEMLERFDISW